MKFVFITMCFVAGAMALPNEYCQYEDQCDDDIHFKGEKRPNIVIIMTCSTGWSDFAWNYPATHTPNLKRMAEEGVILNQTYVQTLCTPTRAALLTGYYPFRAGLGHLVIYPQQPSYLRRNFTTLAEALKPLGYSTHMQGKWHLGACRWDVTPWYRGFDSFLGIFGMNVDYDTYKTTWGQENMTVWDTVHSSEAFLSVYDNSGIVRNEEGKFLSELLFERAVDIIHRHNTNIPLFLYHPTVIAHFPFEAPKRFRDLHAHIDDHVTRNERAMFSLLDEGVGNITRALEDKGMLENTLFLFLADHGMFADTGRNWPFRAGAGTTFEGAIRSPAFIHGKGIKKTGYVNNEVIHVTDFFPTLLSAAGGEPDPKLDGYNIWDTLSKGHPTPRTETLLHLDVNPDSFHYVIRVGDFKLMDGQWNILDNDACCGKMSKRSTKAGWYAPIDLQNPDLPKYTELPGNTTLLFNIAEDPRETTDLSESMPDKLQELRGAARKYIESAPPTFYPKFDYKSGNPANYDNVFSPGWC